MSYYVLIAAVVVLLTGIIPAGAKPVAWDYVKKPVKAAEGAEHALGVLGGSTQAAFDGYGAQGERPAAVRAWFTGAAPSDESPAVCEIDYHEPVAVSAFVHYFYVPGNKDMRFLSPAPSAFSNVHIYSRNEGDEWSEVAVFDDLPATCPQVIPVNARKAARHWKIEVRKLAYGAQMMCSYEIETYTEGVPDVKPLRLETPDFEAEFAERVSTHRPRATVALESLEFSQPGSSLDFTLSSDGRSAKGSLKALVHGQAVVLDRSGADTWTGPSPGGRLAIQSMPTRMGLLLQVSYVAEQDNPIKYQTMVLQMSAPEVDLYYIPAYAWSRTPVESMPSSSVLQTRMAALGTQAMTLCLAPGTDRGSLGISAGTVSNVLVLGSKPTPVLITAVAGDWWTAYQFAVNDIYGFGEQLQTVPVSEIQNGISRYLLRDDIWNPALGTLKTWPPRDLHTPLHGVQAFAFYGAPYSIPAYWARYVMNGDRLALDRARSIAHWLCRSGVRVQDGPAKGAFFSLQVFGSNEVPSLDKRGVSQAMVPTLTSQATGASLWSLLYYRRATGEADAEIDRAITEAADWLLKTQGADGGWPYGHDVSGNLADGAPSSGSVWNIWSLWQLGKSTGDPRYADAASRATAWYKKTFMDEHHYHGYWEDVGPNSREGYDAALAAVAFDAMGLKDLVVPAAMDAIQWVYTRQLEHREPSNSAGLVAEQTGWPPASYCNPMMALAAYSAWKVSGDDVWRAFAMIPKAIGWWYEPETGATVWIVDSTAIAPLVGPGFESWWSDWCIAQTGTLTLRWLVREFNTRSLGEVAIDEDVLSGEVFGQSATPWCPPSGFRPVLPAHGQVNWLGFRGDGSLVVGFANYGEAGSIACPLDSRDVTGAAFWPKAIRRFGGGKPQVEDWSGEFPVDIGHGETIFLEWGLRR